jgi:hypothetical protein
MAPDFYWQGKIIMKRIAIALLTIGLCSTSATVLADQSSRYSGGKVLRGTVFSVGRVDPTENIGTGHYFDVNYSSVALNIGAATKKFGDTPIRASNNSGKAGDGERVNNVYAGIGFSRILMLQYGYGNHGDVLRLRSDFNFRAVADFLSGKVTPKDRMLLADRLTFSVSAERYNDSDEEIFDNATWGIGLLF